MVEIVVENLFFKYPEAENYVLKNINLIIKEGESIAILGENGAGKTTLAKNLNGLLKPTQGSVKIDGVDTRNLSVAKIARKIGFVCHNPDHQFFAETVEEEIRFGLRNFGFPENEAERSIREVLKTFGLEDYRFRNPFQLSGGEKKRLAIASIMVWNPELLILDEPTIGMDYAQRLNIQRVLKKLVSEGRSIVVITHDVDFAASLCERAIILSKGEVIGDGCLRKLLSDSEVIEKASLKKPFLIELEEELGFSIMEEDFDEICDFLTRVFPKCHS
ncbi:MAG: ABC transporter ATP-binding protein [Candidatus Brockarchaeota archaeon]|nr:ABC transporter ATP-binding protein [Candidatus Brockarchaeota archaeon]